jgi:hypothetical protein
LLLTFIFIYYWTAALDSEIRVQIPEFSFGLARLKSGLSVRGDYARLCACSEELPTERDDVVKTALDETDL